MYPNFLLMSLSGRDYIEREVTPSEEPCTNAGEDLSQMYLEGNTLQAQLIRQFGPPPEDFNFCLTTCPHDGGTYMSLRLEYDEDEESESMEYALKIDGDWPKYWDDQAQSELASNNYPLLKPTKSLTTLTELSYGTLPH